MTHGNQATAAPIVAAVTFASVAMSCVLPLSRLSAAVEDASGREFSVFAGSGGPIMAGGAVGHEFSVFIGSMGPAATEDEAAREFSVFVPDGAGLAVVDSTSREFSILISQATLEPVTDIAGREFSVHVLAPPTILLADSALNYVEGDGVVAIDAAARVFDPDSDHFGGGTLHVEIVGGTSGDRLGILDGGTEAGSISPGSGSEVLFGGEIIGSRAGGTGGEPLVISLNASTTLAAAEALVRNISFANSTRFPPGGLRAVRFILSDPDAGPGPPAEREILVIPVNHPPVAGSDFLGAEMDVPLVFSVGRLLENDHDPDGDPMDAAFSDENTRQGGLMFLAEGIVTYTPPASFTGTDRVEYTLSDPYGGVDSGQVTIFVRAPDDPSVTVMKTAFEEDDSFAVDLIGLPGRSYDLLASDDLVRWEAIATKAADGTGRLSFIDPEADLYPRRFYTFRFEVP